MSSLVEKNDKEGREGKEDRKTQNHLAVVKNKDGGLTLPSFRMRCMLTTAGLYCWQKGRQVDQWDSSE